MPLLSEVRNREFKQIEVVIHDPAGSVNLNALLVMPSTVSGFVVFAHGSGSSSASPRNQQVAKELAEHRTASLLFDLLTPQEAEDRRNVFNTQLLSERLIMATHWLRLQSFYHENPIAYFGASTGASAALMAAAKLPHQIAGIVSRGGRSDLVPNSLLMKVDHPVLFIAGELDEPVIHANRKSSAYLPHSKVILIPGASHLFEEQGAMERVSSEAIAWFQKCFREKELERLINLQ
jgi:putative phosphoribosyl transferase